MIGEHAYQVAVEWTGNRGEGTTGYRDYARDVRVSIDGKAEILASADKAFRGDASRWNPEDMLVASLAQCHLLAYLHMCVAAGVVVTAYTDQASGIMREDGAGGGAFTEVILRPRVTVADASMREAAQAAHDAAHEKCFIANSVNFPVRHEATIDVA